MIFFVYYELYKIYNIYKLIIKIKAQCSQVTKADVALVP